MDIKELEPEYSKLTPQQQKELNERLERTLLAFKINNDTEFYRETMQDIAKDYPFLKKYIDRTIY